MSDLLKILSKHHEDLPKDGRTLLKTKSRSDITVMKDMYGQNAEYVYIGLENQLIDLVKIIVFKVWKTKILNYCLV